MQKQIWKHQGGAWWREKLLDRLGNEGQVVMCWEKKARTKNKMKESDYVVTCDTLIWIIWWNVKKKATNCETEQTVEDKVMIDLRRKWKLQGELKSM